MLLPNHGLTGYYLYIPEEENVSLHPIDISPSETYSYLKKKIYEGYPNQDKKYEEIENKPLKSFEKKELEKIVQSYEKCYCI